MDTLVVGANGLLGSNVIAEALDRGFPVTAAYHSTPPAIDVEAYQLEIAEQQAVDRVLEATSPDVVVNCAAITDVDGCTGDERRAEEVNGLAPGRLARSVDKRDIEFVHVSTDYVFDGRKEGRYTETDEVNPIQAYGRSKLLGERQVKEAHSNPIIPRLSFVYGMRGDTDRLEGFPSWLRDRLNAGEEVPLFTDQRVTPTRAGHAAEVILDLVRKGTNGLYHVASQSCVSPFEFGDALAKYSGVDRNLLTEGSLTDVDRAAERPSNTCLCSERLETTLGRPQPTLEEDITAIREAL
jgi:dTDP-4-dehydrorhamnose reductase